MGGALCKWFAEDRMLFYHGAHGLGGGGHQLLYQVVRKSGAQEWSVLFRGAGWSSRQALPATRGRLCFVLQLGAYGDTLGGGTRHLAIPV